MRRVAAAPGVAPILALLAIAACDRPLPTEARPALWRVADGDTVIWLFGTIHALPPGVAWQTLVVARAVREADTLILEVPPADPQAANAAFRAVAEAPGLPPLLTRMPLPLRAGVARALAATGQSADAFDGYKTWAAALALTAAAGGKRGATGGDGVEAVLAHAFAGRAIGALETRAGQFALFDRLPEAAQRALLLQAAAAATRQGPDDATTTAWERGDERALTATLAPLAATPALERPLVADRNARWTTAIARRMARPGRVLVAVGAGHLVGPGSVVARLRARGWRVVRVQ